MENNKNIVKTGPNHEKWKLLMTVLAFGVEIGLIILTIIGLSYLKFYYLGYTLPIYVALAGSIAFFVIYHVLNKKQKYKWYLNLFLASIPNLAIILLFTILAGDLNDFDIGIHSYLSIVMGGGAIVLFSSILIIFYYSMQNAKKIESYNKVKFATYAIIIMFLAIIITGGGLIYNRFANSYPEATILEGNGHDDGPWLTFGEDPTNSITISWLTKEKTTSTVKFGLSQNALDQTTTLGDQESYLHHVVISNLQSDMTYYYEIQDFESEQDQNTSIFQFKTVPSQDQARPFKFVVIGDRQPHSSDEEIMASNLYMAEHLRETEMDFLLQVGDIVDSGDDLEEWHDIFESLSLFTANTTIQASIGNHDWDSIVGASNWGEIFPYPYENPDEGKFYSFDYLNAHFVMIDNFETMYQMSNAQIQWLENDLKQANSENKWIFCFFHLSIFSTGTANMEFNLQGILAPIFGEYGVDGVFYGHDHMYEHYNYDYGENGLVHSPDHTTDYQPVHYWETGGGGANLEGKYGLANPERGTEIYERQWYNLNTSKWETREYYASNWNASRNVTWADPNWSPGNPETNANFYHDTDIECYQDEAIEYGHDYGENTLHYMLVEIDGDTCTISARYPDGTLMDGPTHKDPQSWVFTK